MLSIIWSILKIIGIIILVILGFLLAILLLILFVPFRYEVKASGHFGQAEEAADYLVRARVSWLLRFITVKAGADKKGFTAKLKILGIPFFRIGEEKKTKKPKSRKKSQDKSAETDNKDEDSGPISVGLPEELPAEEGRLSIQEPVRNDQVKEENGEPEKKKNFLKRLIGKIKGIFRSIREKIRSFFGKLASLFKNVREKIQKAMSMAGEIRDFLENEKNKEAIRFVLGEGKKLFLHILPRRFSGQISFSLEDPASTGQVLMILGFVYPVLQDRIQVMPLFENRTYIEGDIHIKGRIRVFSLLIIVLKVWFYKRFKAFIRRGKKLKENLGRAGERSYKPQ